MKQLNRSEKASNAARSNYWESQFLHRARDANYRRYCKRAARRALRRQTRYLEQNEEHEAPVHWTEIEDYGS